MPAFDPYHKWLGIPPEDSGVGRLHHYRLLGISLFEADADAIASAADQRMAHLRSFQNGPNADLSQTLLNQVAAAGRCLLAPDRKAEYDARLRQSLDSAPKVAPAPDGGSPSARPLRIAASLTAAEVEGSLAKSRAGARGGGLGSLGFGPAVPPTSKKSRRPAKRGQMPVAFWAPIVAVMALLAVIWIASQSDVGPSPAVVATGKTDIRNPADSRAPTPAKLVGDIQPQRDPSPGSGIRENSGVEQQDPAAQTDSPAAPPEQAAQKPDDNVAAPTTASTTQAAASSEPKPPPGENYPVEHKPPSHATGKPTPLPSDAFVVSLAQDQEGRIWIGTEDLGVFRYDPSAAGPAQWTEFTAADGLGDDNAYALCVDRLNRVWVGHLNHGVSVYNGESWANYDVLDGPIGERIFSIAADPKSGDVWIATSAGLTHYSLEKDNWTHYTRDDGLPSDQIQSLAFDSRGTLYAGTQCDGLAISDPPRPPPVSREALAAGRAAPEPPARRWRQIIGPDTVPLAPAGPGLPSNLINDILVSRSGTVFVATTCGLAASADHGKSWSFIRGADCGAKVKGLYGGPPRGWRQGPAALLLTEDYCTCLAEDDSGVLWIGHRQTGYEAIDPRALERRFDSRKEGPGAGAHGPAKDGGEASKKIGPDYAMAMLAMPNGPPLVGWYGAGLRPNLPAGKSTTKLVAAAATSPARHPTSAAPPSVEELNALLARLARVSTVRQLSPAVVQIPDDWRTQGDWLGRYGRYWACCCAMCSPADFIWGAGPESVGYIGRIGPNHTDPADSLRYWVHRLYTSDRRSLEIPPTYFDNRVKSGLTTPERNRRQSEWDDHGEAYSQAIDGPDVYCTLAVPPGQFCLSLYDFNKDGHEASNRFRDFRVSIRPHDQKAALRSIDDFGRKPELVAGRIYGFWGGVWKRYYVQGPIGLTVQVRRIASFNTILAGVMLDYLDERPVPYFCNVHVWEAQMAGQSEDRGALLAESAEVRAERFSAQADAPSAGERLFRELDRLRSVNMPWWAAETRRYYLPLARLYTARGSVPDERGARKRLATCVYQLGLFRQWEELQRAEMLTPARDIEKALRWNGLPYSNSGIGYHTVLSYLRKE